MEKIFCLGLVMGAVGGALLVANSYKVRSFVKKSQAEVMQKIDEKMDECLKQKDGKGQNEEEKSEKKKK